MKLKSFLSFLSYMERAFLLLGYVYALYYIYNLTAPLSMKAFGAALATVFIIIYAKQVLKKSKSSIDDLEIKNAEPSRLLDFDRSVVKCIAIFSLLGCISLVLTIVNEVLVNQISHYFPLKLLGIVFLYLVLRGSLRSLIKRPLSKIKNIR